jgi:sterol 3beta-glucosyltransferase
VVSDPEEMTRCVVDAVVESGCCAILSKGWSDRGSKKDKKDDKDGEDEKEEKKEEKEEKNEDGNAKGADGVKYPAEILYVSCFPVDLRADCAQPYRLDRSFLVVPED